MKLGLYLRNMGPQSTSATLVAVRVRPRPPVSTTSGSPTTSRSRPTNPRARAAATSIRSRPSRSSPVRPRINLGTAVLVLRIVHRSRPRNGSRRSRSFRRGDSFGVGVGWMEAEFRATGATRARGRTSDGRSTSSLAASRTTRSRATASRFSSCRDHAPADSDRRRSGPSSAALCASAWLDADAAEGHRPGGLARADRDLPRADACRRQAQPEVTLLDRGSLDDRGALRRGSELRRRRCDAESPTRGATPTPTSSRAWSSWRRRARRRRRADRRRERPKAGGARRSGRRHRDGRRRRCRSRSAGAGVVAVVRRDGGDTRGAAERGAEEIQPVDGRAGLDGTHDRRALEPRFT